MGVKSKIEEIIGVFEGKLEAMKDDAVKFDAGNGAAGTRLRKAFMDLRNDAQRVRQGIQKIKTDRKNA